MGEKFLNFIARLSELALVGLLLLVTLADVALVISMDPPGRWSVLAGDAAGIVAVAVRRRWPQRATLTLLGCSAALTFFRQATGFDDWPGNALTCALAVLTITVLRRVHPITRAAGLALLTLVVIEFSTFPVTGAQQLGVRVIDFLGWGTAVAIGGYLRVQQDRREKAVDAVRRAERLELARELHDMVAHHVTGIVVQAQAARTVAAQRPEAVLPALDAIATAGVEALASMRRMVGVLRTEEEAGRTPGSALSDLRDLVNRFSAHGPEVHYTQVLGTLLIPPEVVTTLHRVLTEALTNVRRHALTAAWVDASLTAPQGVLRLRVVNPVPGGHRAARDGGGFGLVGMAERVQALGGELYAGPGEAGHWEVIAEFPTEPFPHEPLAPATVP